MPTLGQPARVFAHGAGFGLIRPSRIFNGGDPTGLVTDVTWTSWGGASATGTGTSEYVGPGQSVAAGRGEAATVVAFDLGTCGGKLMYRAVEWYFPQHGQSFRPGGYEDICTGSYVPAGSLTAPGSLRPADRARPTAPPGGRRTGRVAIVHHGAGAAIRVRGPRADGQPVGLDRPHRHPDRRRPRRGRGIHLVRGRAPGRLRADRDPGRRNVQDGSVLHGGATR